MLKLVIVITRQLLSAKICGLIILWQVFAYQLSFYPHLAPSSLGSFLSYQILGIVLLLFRFGLILEQRHLAGWVRLSSLKNTYYREILSEFLAGTLLLVFISFISTIILLLCPPEISSKLNGYHPITAKNITESSWELSWKDALPKESKFCLTFDLIYIETILFITQLFDLFTTISIFNLLIFHLFVIGPPMWKRYASIPGQHPAK